MASSRKVPAAPAAEFARIDAAVADAIAALDGRSGHHAAGSATLLVAFSGGLDSTVLLDAVVRVVAAAPDWRAVAVHVHHGLQPTADAWPEHCAEVAGALGVPFESLRVQVAMAGQGLEAAAREARYAAIAGRARALGARAVLTAHHLDDQLETLLMRLARGTGPDGLAGIAADAPFAPGGDGCRLLRPLLAIDRATLVAAARARDLRWIEDPSNADPRHTRNAVRARLLPALDEALPGWRRGFARAACLLGEARDRLAQQAGEDLARCRTPERAGCLDAGRLAALAPARRRAAWRAWIAALGARAPSARRLDEIDRLATGTAGGEVVHEGWRLRCWRGRIDATPLARDVDRRARAPAPPDVTIVWQGESAMALPGWPGRLCFDTGAGPDGEGDGPGLDPAWLAGRALRISARRDRARMRTAPGACRHDLKALYQARGVPPWQRPTLPLVFEQHRLLFAAGIGIDHDAVARTPGTVRLRWCPDQSFPRGPDA